MECCNRLLPVQAPVLENRTKSICQPLRRWNVILHNDDVNNTDFVVKVLMECVASLSEIEAACCMLEAHQSGLSVVITEPYEAAEFHYERLTFFDLTITLEPAD